MTVELRIKRPEEKLCFSFAECDDSVDIIIQKGSLMHTVLRFMDDGTIYEPGSTPKEFRFKHNAYGQILRRGLA